MPDATYLQPVYLFNATLHPLGKGSAEHVRGYVAVGRLAERIPVIGQSFRGIGPTAPRPGSAG